MVLSHWIRYYCYWWHIHSIVIDDERYWWLMEGWRCMITVIVTMMTAIVVIDDDCYGSIHYGILHAVVIGIVVVRWWLYCFGIIMMTWHCYRYELTVIRWNCWWLADIVPYCHYGIDDVLLLLRKAWPYVIVIVKLLIWQY